MYIGACAKTETLQFSLYNTVSGHISWVLHSVMQPWVCTTPSKKEQQTSTCFCCWSDHPSTSSPESTWHPLLSSRLNVQPVPSQSAASDVLARKYSLCSSLCLCCGHLKAQTCPGSLLCFLFHSGRPAGSATELTGKIFPAGSAEWTALFIFLYYYIVISVLYCTVLQSWDGLLQVFRTRHFHVWRINTNIVWQCVWLHPAAS